MTHDLRRITLDPFGNIYEVATILDRHGKLTDEPALASTCVIVFQGDYIEQDADDVPIYTVH